MNDRARRTERTALRLIKSWARKYIYMAQSKRTDGAAYDQMLLLETAIGEEALREWHDTLATWPDGFEQLALPPIIGKVAIEAYEECRATCEDIGPGAKQALNEFFIIDFDPNDLLIASSALSS